MARKWTMRTGSNSSGGSTGVTRSVSPKKQNANDTILCPVCGKECSMYFINDYMGIVGCENCVRRINARVYEDVNYDC